MNNWDKAKELAERYFYPHWKWWWLILAVVYWAFCRQGKQIWLSLKKEKKKIFRQVGLFLLIMALVHFLVKLIFISLFSTAQAKLIERLIQQITEAKNFCGLLPVIFGSCLVAPIIEECLYRFFIFEVLGKKNIFSYLLSYFIFILAHWQNGDNFVSLFVQYSVAAIGFIWIYKKSNWNLTYPIILHSLVNLLFISIALTNSNFPLF